ncbi:Integrase catalytic domain-containing protein [Citrus sinensis]|uniref:Integrase catalytic domain-containing protein n=1 Tax=Citrus sinensis TaxID=2711 RepID=A0ACB8MCG6_CITSI|nr:Integrase catalytic domain-containing protein [Citrus sinensis]
MTGDRPKEWAKWLTLAEWWYNTSFHLSTKTTPFKVIYGIPPLNYTTYTPGESNVTTLEESVIARDAMIRLLKENLNQAQNWMKQAANKNRTEREFEVGDMVIQQIGKVAYKLELPPDSRIHPIFHVSCLKKRIGEAVEPQLELPPT